MIIVNTRGKIYGQIAATSGYILSIIGLITMTIGGILVAFAGLFVGFTTRGTMLDTDQKRFKEYQKYFGIVTKGNWRPVSEMQSIRLVTHPLNGTNHSIRIKKKTIHIILQGKFEHEHIFVKQCTTLDNARIEAQRLSELLGLPLELGGTRA